MPTPGIAPAPRVVLVSAAKSCCAATAHQPCEPTCGTALLRSAGHSSATAAAETSPHRMIDLDPPTVELRRYTVFAVRDNDTPGATWIAAVVDGDVWTVDTTSHSGRLQRLAVAVFAEDPAIAEAHTYELLERHRATRHGSVFPPPAPGDHDCGTPIYDALASRRLAHAS